MMYKKKYFYTNFIKLYILNDMHARIYINIYNYMNKGNK